jgi:hypothetical protein
MRLARRRRGRASLADAVFPLMLMHVGQGENLYMGYQLAFMLTAALAAGLLAVMLLWRQDSDPVGTNNPAPTGSESCRHESRFGRVLLATVLGWLLLTCGAAGIAYGVAAAAWVLYLAVFDRYCVWQRLVLVALTLVTPAYIGAYMQGYVRPGHHPPSAGVVESARIGLEAQAMALGPGMTGLWEVQGDAVLISLLLIGLVVVGRLLTWVIRAPLDSRAVGLLLYVAAAAAVAFGIGWGRSGFHNDMGFAWRYGWITAPAVWAAYFTWLVRPGRVSTYGPAALAVAALLLFPANEASGYLDAERKVRPFEAAWEADVRAGRTAAEVFDRHHPGWSDPFRREAIAAMRLMRDRRYTYYESLGAEAP